MHETGYNEKQRNEDNCANAETAYQAQTPRRNIPGIAGMYSDEGTLRRPSNREEAEHQVGYHRLQADRHDKAAAFFRENPAFDQFIQLIREGAISI
jgi:hypothetical protein